MPGVVALVVVVVAALVLTGAAAARAAMRSRWQDAALRRVEDALRPTGDVERERRIADLAIHAAQEPAGQAGAMVVACRRVFSREVAPLLVALLQHPDPGVGDDAGRALTDLGAPGLRAVWGAFRRAQARGAARDRLRDMLAAHPDWLFETLVDGYVVGGDESVRSLRELWDHSGMRARLSLMGAHSDAVGAIRARDIEAVLTAPDSARALAGARAD